LKLSKIYELAVKYGIQKDPRGKDISEDFKNIKKWESIGSKIWEKTVKPIGKHLFFDAGPIIKVAKFDIEQTKKVIASLLSRFDNV